MSNPSGYPNFFARSSPGQLQVAEMKLFPELSERFRLFKLRMGQERARRELASRVEKGRNWRARPHGLPRGLVVSLTSYPPRYGTLLPTLQSLMFQTLRPDRLLLWLTRPDADGLPQEVLALAGEGLEIRLCEDLRSYNKIIPTLEAFPDQIVVTADDDVYYWPTWLEELVTAHTSTGDPVICHRAHLIAQDSNGRPLPYGEWNQRRKSDMRSPLLLPTGVLGVLYDPRIFHADVTRRDLFTRLCPTADDIWLYWMHRLNGSIPHLLRTRRRIIEWPGSQTAQLMRGNVREGGNDEAIAAMIRHYGFPDVGTGT